MDHAFRGGAPPDRRSRRAIDALQLGLRLGLLVGLLASSAQAAPGDGCAPGHFIDETLPSGGHWQMCWAIRSEEGLVLSNVWYNGPGAAARKVLAEAALSQIHVSDDDGSAPALLVTGPGLGGGTLRELGPAECPGGTLLSDGGRDVVCRRVDAMGFLYKYYNTQKQSQALRLSHVSQIGDVVYMVQWRFLDTGGIEPAVRRTGRLPKIGGDARYGWPLGSGSDVGVGRVHNYVWRLAFDIAGNGANEVVEELEFTPASSSSRLVMSRNVLATETGRSAVPERMRSWRILDDDLDNADGHPVSYHLEPLDLTYRYDGGVAEPWSEHDFWATVTKPCERFAVGNPTGGGCGSDLAAFADGESIDRAHITLWHVISTYHVPRSEDVPFVNSRWEGFRIVPRDWSSVSPF